MLNPRWHEEFAALCAIPTHKLSEEEWALLQIHLAYCDPCLKTFQEHPQRSFDVLPGVDGAAHNERQEIDSHGIQDTQSADVSPLR